jgi:hypothetical protein
MKLYAHPIAVDWLRTSACFRRAFVSSWCGSSAFYDPMNYNDTQVIGGASDLLRAFDIRMHLAYCNRGLVLSFHQTGRHVVAAIQRLQLAKARIGVIGLEPLSAVLF